MVPGCVVLSVVTSALGGRADDPVWETALLSRPGLTARDVRGGKHGQQEKAPRVGADDASRDGTGRGGNRRRSRGIYVAVPSDRDAEPARCFGTFTPDLMALADWCRPAGSAPWPSNRPVCSGFPCFKSWRIAGFRSAWSTLGTSRTCPAVKSDVLDCQWLRHLHSVGLLHASFRPYSEISGGQVLSSRTRMVNNRAALAQRLAARSLYQSHSYLGEYCRCMRAKLGAPKAIVAAAHKLARILYHLITRRQPYQESIFAELETRFRQRAQARLEAQARALGFRLAPVEG
jgi:hypothetical protein